MNGIVFGAGIMDTLNMMQKQGKWSPLVEKFNPCPAENIKMPCPLLIFSLSNFFIQGFETNTHT